MSLPPSTHCQTSCWQMESQIAMLHTRPLVGQVVLDSPQQGIEQLRCFGIPLTGWLLGIASEGGNELGARQRGGWQRQDSYVRGNDLVASYRNSDDEQVTLQMYWAIQPPAVRGIVSPGALWIDAIVSVQTDALQSQQRVAVSTQLECDELVYLASDTMPRGANATSEELSTPVLESSAADQSTAPGCAIFRLRDLPWSYAEMAHPVDFQQWQKSNVAHDSRHSDIWQSCWDLCGQPLEKGVIYRIRLRGALLPREDDLQLASDGFAQFADENPPLTA